MKLIDKLTELSISIPEVNPAINNLPFGETINFDIFLPIEIGIL